MQQSSNNRRKESTTLSNCIACVKYGCFFACFDLGTSRLVSCKVLVAGQIVNTQVVLFCSD